VHLSPCATVRLIERGDIPTRIDRGVVKEDESHHCMNETMGRRSRESLIDCRRHTQEYAADIANHHLSSRWANYRKFGQRSSIGNHSMHRGTSPSEVFVHHLESKYLESTSRVTQGRVT